MARFFNIPIHYREDYNIYSVANSVRTAAPGVNDNDYTTYSTATDYVIQTHGTSLADSTTINFVNIIGSGIGSYNLQVVSGKGTGGGVTNRVIPSTVMTPEGTSQDTTIDGVQYDLLDLRNESVTVVNNQSLTGSTATVANNLSSINSAVSVTVSLSSAALTDVMTAGTVEIVGENPSGTVVRQTLSFANDVLNDPQISTTTFVRITTVNLTGFSAGTITITSGSGALYCTEAQLTITGTDVRIYQIRLLDQLLYLDSESFFLNINTRFLRNSLEKTSMDGQNYRVPGLGSRGKYMTSMSTHLRDWSPVSFNQFMSFAENYENFTFSEQYERYPKRVYLATWGANFNINYFNQMLENGQVANITIQET